MAKQKITSPQFGQPVAFSTSYSISVGTGASVDVDGGTEDYDYGGNFDDSTGIFTAPYDGVYLFYMEGSVSNVGDTKQMILRLRNEGLTKWESGAIGSTSGSDVRPSITGAIEMAAGDEATFQIYQNKTTTATCAGRIGGHLIGRTD